jgi:hypothetical protein
VGFKALTPQYAAGMRREPAVSVPREKRTAPLATAAAEPELEPPVMRSAAQGLRQSPQRALWPVTPSPHSSRFDLATTYTPARSIRRTTVAWRRATAPPSLPAVVVTPATSMRSFTAQLAPASGPVAAPAIGCVARFRGAGGMKALSAAGPVTAS